MGRPLLWRPWRYSPCEAGALVRALTWGACHRAVEVGHALGRRQADLGTLDPRTLTVAPGPKACLSWLQGEGLERKAKCRGPPITCGPGLTHSALRDTDAFTSPRRLGNCPS